MNDRDQRQRGRPFKSGGGKGGDRPPRPGAGNGGKSGGKSGGKPAFRKRDGDKPRFQKRDGETSPRFQKRDGETSPRFQKRDGETSPRFQKRDGDKPRFQKRDGDKPRFGKNPYPARAPRGGREQPETAPRHPDQGERIAKAMARAGACSRRDAEEWIAAGRVSVNGRVLTSPAFNVAPTDRIEIDGKPLAARERTRLFLFHKPRGFVTTDRDPEGRATIFDFLDREHPQLPRLMTVGRLDINTEGLLLLTNDGGLARVLELPATGWLRRYRVRAHGQTDQAALDALARGVTVEGVDYAPIEARLDRVQGANTWITLSLREGKNREVRRVLGAIGLEVNRLIRVSYGPFQLGEMDEGAVEEVKTRVLRDQLGPALIAAAGADFAAPVAEPAREERPRPALARRAPPVRAPRGEEEPPPRLDRPQAGPRKHISRLRAERAERDRAGEPRVRREHSQTADRKGRAVAVERVVPAAPKQDFDTRNARRFGAERAAASAGKGAGARFGKPRSPVARPREDEGLRPPRRPRAAPIQGDFARSDFERKGERPAFRGARAAPGERPRRGPSGGAPKGPSGRAPKGPSGGAPKGPPKGAPKGPPKGPRKGPPKGPPKGPRGGR